MSTQERKESFERSKRAIGARPSIGLSTATSSTRIVDGYTCEIEEGRWNLTADLHPKSGGNGKGPDSGVLVRAAFGSCCAITYVQWAAVMGIQLSSVEVVVEVDYNHAGYYDVADVPPGPLEVRYKVKIESDAPESEIIALLNKADRHSPLHDLFARPMKLERTLELNSGN